METNFTEQELEQMLNAVRQQQGGGNPVDNQQFSVTMNGKTYSFATQEQLDNFVNESFNNYGQAMQAARTQEAYLQAQQQQRQQQQAQPEIKPDVAKFADKLLENPGEAIEYAWGAKLGVERPSEVLKGMAAQLMVQQRELSEMKQELVARQWVENNDDYNPSPENAQKLMGLLQQMNLPISYANLDAAYSYGIRSGVFQDAPAQQTAASPAPVTPPRISRGNTFESTGDVLRDVENLSTSQLEDLIARFSPKS